MKISIVIPTRNGIETLPEVLDAIASQELAGACELVAIDSGSTDGTSELLRKRADRLLEIAPEAFNHGLTRNQAIAECRGELVVLLVQDAIPASPSWLSELTAPLHHERSLAGTFARQLPRPDAERLTRWALSGWVGAQEQPWLHAVEDRASFLAQSPVERYLTCVFDNVCSCIRRSVWDRHPFPATPIAEDVEWARTVLLAGYQLAYVPSAMVVHSHERSLRYELVRTFQVHRRLRHLFELRTIPSLGHLLRAWLSTTAAHLASLYHHEGPRPGPAAILRALGLAIVWPAGQYLGARHQS